MDFHGAPLNRTWVKLDRPTKPGDSDVTLLEPVTGWRAGDRVILTAARPEEYQEETKEPAGKRKGVSGTEERLIVSVEGRSLRLDKPLIFEHSASADNGRCEV